MITIPNGPAVVVDDTADFTVTVDVTSYMRDKVFEVVMGFYKNHGAWTGESIMQRDEPLLDSPILLAGLLDYVINPTITNK